MDFIQKIFCAIDYGKDEKKALEAKKEWVKQKRKEGFEVHSHKMSLQLRSPPHTVYPESENTEWTTCYIANANKKVR
jgi:hypothetical protein